MQVRLLRDRGHGGHVLLPPRVLFLLVRPAVALRVPHQHQRHRAVLHRRQPDPHLPDGQVAHLPRVHVCGDGLGGSHSVPAQAGSPTTRKRGVEDHPTRGSHGGTVSYRGTLLLDAHSGAVEAGHVRHRGEQPPDFPPVCAGGRIPALQHGADLSRLAGQDGLSALIRFVDSTPGRASVKL